MTTAIRELIAGLPGINVDEWMKGRSFPLVEGRTATLALDWGTVRVPLRIVVP